MTALVLWGRAARAVRLMVVLLLVGAAPTLLFHGCAKRPAAVMYHCPMHPTYMSDHPADCPICNMAMVPVPASETTPTETAGSPGTGASGMEGSMPSMGSDQGTMPPAAGGGQDHVTVHIAPDEARRSGMVTVEADYGRIARATHAVGYVVADESRRTSVEARTGGWVRFLHVAATGRTVEAGEPLLVFESPDLLVAQQEYASALNAADRLSSDAAPEIHDNLRALAASARSRLELFGLPKASIEDLARTRQPLTRVPLVSPARGTVITKNVVEGQRVEPGMLLFALADLSKVWIEARLFENDFRSVHIGQTARLTVASEPSWDGVATVSQVVPSVDEATRTLLVRLNASNDDGRLVPGAYADVAFEESAETGVVIPVSAILDTGARKLVYVKRSDDHYEPREVVTGPTDGQSVIITSGIAAGEAVVAQAAFLVDSESRLKASITRALTGGHVHGGGGE